MKMKKLELIHHLWFKFYNKWPLLILLIFSFPLSSFSQEEISVKGIVQSADDQLPLPGVSINAGDKTVGTSGANGEFLVTIPTGTELKFTFIGFNTHTVKITKPESNLQISLETSSTSLEDVVVVGYGTQKKVNLTGSISTLSMEEKAGEPTTNISNALAGMPGMFVHLGQSQPGLDRSEIRIRGMGTLSDNNPLVLVNGVEYSIDEINPDDIETVTVLKDASAAIYGSRAANGVILLTTKTGKGKGQVNYNYYYGSQKPTTLPDVIWDPIEYMHLKNQAMRNQGNAPNYSDAEIAEYEAGMATDPFTYPASNWYDIALKNGNIQKHNLSFSGAEEKYQYRLSLGFLDRDGIMIGPSDKEKKYSLGLDVSMNVTDKLKVGASINGYYRNYDEPAYGSDFFKHLSRSLPILTDTLADGRYGDSWLATPGRNNFENPRLLAETGNAHKVVQRFLASLSADYQLPWDINYSLKFGADKYDGLLSTFTPQVKHYNPKTGKATNWNSPATAPRSMNTDYNDLKLHFYNTLDWNKQFAEKHNVALMLGSSYDEFGTGIFSADMTGYLDGTLTALDAGSIRRVISGHTTNDVLISYFGRANYDYKEKYLFEATFRYDGSSRFAPGQRWGFFPSVSAGWRIDKEDFFQSDFFNLLKLRGSAGQMGNQAVALYSYENSITLNHDYSFGGANGELAPGAAATAYSDPSTSWETTTAYNLGLDMDFMNNRFNVTADIYKKRTTGILRTVNFPSQIGLTGPQRNVGTVENTGYEISAQYRNTVGEFSYSAQGNISYNKNNVVDLDGQILYNFGTNLSTITQAGYPIDSHYLLQSDGFFQNQEEIDKHAYQSTSTKPGYIRYKDINEDGIINGDDRVIISESSAIPKYTYGFGLNAGYKGISLKAAFQGIAGIKVYPVGNLAFPFSNGAGATKEWLTDAWTPENPNARLPIVTESTGGKDNFQQSDFWLHDGSFLRLKSLQLAYLIPQQWTSRLKVSKISVFVNAENYLTFTKYKDFDPETIINYSSIYHYPMLKTISGGINVTF